MCITGHDQSSELNMLNLRLDGGSLFPDSPQDNERIEFNAYKNTYKWSLPVLVFGNIEPVSTLPFALANNISSYTQFLL